MMDRYKELLIKGTAISYIPLCRWLLLWDSKVTKMAIPVLISGSYSSCINFLMVLSYVSCIFSNFNAQNVPQVAFPILIRLIMASILHHMAHANGGAVSIT